MAKKTSKPMKPVIKPYLRGSWHGTYATRKGLKLIFSILFVSFLYLLLGLVLNFDSMVLRVAIAAVLIAFAALYMYFQGANAGEGDTAFSEIMYQHQKEGKPVVDSDRERCYHPGKGFYEILIALLPFLLITFVFALVTKPLTYSLGLLPSWVDAPAQQTHVSEALAYYSVQDYSVAMSILRIVARAVSMPFINIAIQLGTNAVLWAERLTPLWVMVAPVAYGFGYLQGPKVRIKINTGIKDGVRKKKRKERKERKARAQSKGPEQLI